MATESIVQQAATLSISTTGSLMACAAAVDGFSRAGWRKSFGERLKKEWTSSFLSLADTALSAIYGTRLFSARAITVSLLLSTFVVLLLNIHHWSLHENCFDEFLSRGPRGFLNLLVIAFLLNGVGDTISTMKSRAVVRLLSDPTKERFTNRGLVVIILISDIIATLFLFLACYAIGGQLLTLLFGHTSSLIEAFSPAEIIEGVGESLNEMFNYGIFLSATNMLTTGAYLYSALIPVFWSIAISVLAFASPNHPDLLPRRGKLPSIIAFRRMPMTYLALRVSIFLVPMVFLSAIMCWFLIGVFVEYNPAEVGVLCGL